MTGRAKAPRGKAAAARRTSKGQTPPRARARARPARAATPRSAAILVARDAAGAEVERLELTYDAYYEQLHEVIDSNEYRARRGIRTLEGKLWDSAGRLLQDFRIRYAADGAYAGKRVVHDDGTVTEG